MNTFHKTRALLGALLALLTASTAMAQNQGNVTAACDRACLTRVVDAYVAGLIANDPAKAPFAPGAKLTLNDDVVPAGKLFWDQAASVQARIDIANPRWGDTGTQTVINNADGSQYIYVFRLKVKNSRITEAEAMLIRNVEEGGLLDLKTLQKPNPNFNMKIRPAEQDSYYDLVAAAEGYWRAFNTNGTPEYHPAEFFPNVQRLENGYRTTDVSFANNPAMSAAEQFDTGFHAGRNIWDLRYPVVDEEYGVVMSFARFGLKAGFTPNRPAQAATRLVAEFFAVRKGQIWDIQAAMVNRDENVLEPPVPAGLGNLTASLERLADFLCIDFDLIAAAAEQSKSERDPMLSKEEITDWVANLPLEDKNAALVGMIENDASHLAAEVRQRALKGGHAKRQAVSGSQRSNCRSAGQILARAEAIAKERQKIEAERAAREKAKREREQAENRRKHLESLNGKEGDLWAKVNQLIMTKQPKRYDEAVSILQDLHDLAEKNGTSSAFSLRMENLYREHESKRTFVDRLRKARLLIPVPGRILVEEAMVRDAIT